MQDLEECETDTTTFDGHMYFFYYISIKIPMTDIHLLHMKYLFLLYASFFVHTEAN